MVIQLIKKNTIFFKNNFKIIYTNNYVFNVKAEKTLKGNFEVIQFIMLMISFTAGLNV